MGIDSLHSCTTSFVKRELNPKVQEIRACFERISEQYLEHVSQKLRSVGEVEEDVAKKRVVFKVPRVKVRGILSGITKQLFPKSKEQQSSFLFAKEIACEVFQTYNRAFLYEKEVRGVAEKEVLAVLSEKWIITNYISAESVFVARVAGKTIAISPEMVPKKFVQIYRPLEQISCFDYAFLQVREERGFFIDFEPKELPFLLDRWGYDFSAKPEPGDLVLFFNQGTPVHMGVCRDGLIESKWSNARKVAFLHRLEDAPESYGTQVIYCRKESKTESKVKESS